MEYQAIKQKFFFVALLVFSVILCPAISRAATIFSTTEAVPNVSDVFLVRVNLDTKGANINVVEGAIEIKSSEQTVKIQEISLGGSILEFWLNKPTASVEDGKIVISFTGGTPAGINKSDALLFTLVLMADKPGNVSISPVQLTAYAGDGKGSSVKTESYPLNLNIEESAAPSKNEWQDLIVADKLPPATFSASLVQDQSIAEGQKFLVFNAVDNGSGLDYYEVQEGNRPAVRSNGVYIFADQARLSAIKIIAVDKAGNRREINLKPSGTVQEILVETTNEILETTASSVKIISLETPKTAIPLIKKIILALIVLLAILPFRLFKRKGKKSS